ncbi:branched-chain amino acid ABC transporter substrate-binding protein [Herbaspirillum rhizosphaerae]|uniref:branched-chain amino acid ABC transporter substrate-binding protein n=1 Tax=Herbaspirillum rhizosphaerae TaxID=346179 RepID=UPI00067ADDC5|nr:branched-chain amino acid ABC transporter substrate-binding protein [Herbaspirillum rhizosphaerae]
MPQNKYASRRRLLSALFVCSFLLPAAACAEDDRIARLGFVARMPDVLAQSARQGAAIAVDEANEQRARTADAIRFELVPQDDRGNPNMAANVARYFVKSSASGVIGHWSSDAAFAAADIYERAGIAQVNFTSTSSELTSRGYKTAFRVVGSTAGVAASLADAAIDELQGQHIAVIGNDSSSSKALTEAFIGQLTARSKKVLQTATVGATTSDFNTVLKSATEMQADVIFFAAYVAQVPAFLAAVKRLNVKARILLNTGTTNQDVSAEDNGHFYALEADIPQDQCPSWKAFNQKYQARYGRPPSTYSRYAYNAAGALIQAVRQANSTEAAKVTAALHDIRYASLSGEIAFDKAGNRINPPYTLYHAEGASWRPIRFFSADKNSNARCAKS